MGYADYLADKILNCWDRTAAFYGQAGGVLIASPAVFGQVRISTEGIYLLVSHHGDGLRAEAMIGAHYWLVAGSLNPSGSGVVLHYHHLV